MTDFEDDRPFKRRRLSQESDQVSRLNKQHTSSPPQVKRALFFDYADDVLPVKTESPEAKAAEREGRVKLFFDYEDDVRPETAVVQSDRQQSSSSTSAAVSHSFDADTFRSIVGVQVADHEITVLQARYGSNLEAAINNFLDSTANATSVQPPPQQEQPQTEPRIKSEGKQEVVSDSVQKRAADLSITPHRRYIGAFGVAGYMTKSGKALLRSGDVVKIDRTRQSIPQKLGRGGKIRQVIRRTQDVIVRFTNSRGEELGRLEKDQALWISALLDQKVCILEGQCIFAPDRLLTGETVYIQLKAYLLKSAFDSNNFIKPLDNNRETGIFEAKETQDERDLRIRQIGLVKLFNEVNLEPTQINSTTAKHKREGILQAAEMAEQYEQQKTDAAAKSDEGEPGTATPQSDENEEGEELEQDQLDSLYKKAQSFDFNTPEAQPAASFALDLRKYQKQALHWMMAKETSQSSGNQQSMHPLWEEYRWPVKDVDDKDLPAVPAQDSFYVNPYSGELSLDFPVQEQNCLGGILADEMGLGKTIEMLSLVHSHRSPEHEAAVVALKADSVNNLPRLAKGSANIEPAPATTLVVAPMSLLAQWASEAEKASQPGTLKTLMYYGGEKNVNLQTLCSAANVASAPNVIITSYGTVLSEMNAVAASGGSRGSHGGLFSIEYWRVILDEAHMIKNRQSKTAKACYELAAKHRWTLTGTPIVNRLEDLFSLVRFLRVEPWSNFSFWKTFITTPFEKGDFVRALDVVQTVLEPLVIRRTKDMKTPDGQALVPLPPKHVTIERVELSEPERDVYNHIYARAKRTFAANVEAGTLMKSYTTIFAQILRLRQSCCHPLLTRNKEIVAEEEDAAAAADVANGLADDMDLSHLISQLQAADEEEDAARFGANVLQQIQNDVEMECPLCCEEPMVDQCVTGGCWHSACKQCMIDYIEHEKKKNELPRCFNCREPITLRDVFEVVRREEAVDVDDLILAGESFDATKSDQGTRMRVKLQRVNTLSSSKIKVLLKKLRDLKASDPLMKSVVFSQFTSYLDILGPALTDARIGWLRFDGSMSQKERAKVLMEFADATKFTVLFLSLRAGGVGLNLTCAKQVFMMDPWWSFAVEAQAIDRVHRMGQTEEVHVTRFVVSESIEEKMLKVQERKKFIASSLGMMSDEEKKLQRIEDIRELLS